MLEIGKSKLVAVRTLVKQDGKRKIVPVLVDGKPQTKVVSAEVWRSTRNSLDGTFCKDRGRKLVVGLVAGDLIALKPMGLSKRHLVYVKLTDVYRDALQRKALLAQLEKARQRKQFKIDRRDRRRIADADRRISRQAREQNS